MGTNKKPININFTNKDKLGNKVVNVMLYLEQDSKGNRVIQFPQEISWGVNGVYQQSGESNKLDMITVSILPNGRMLGFVDGIGY